MDEVRDPTLGEVIRVGIASQLMDLHVSLPAVVDAYDASKQTVDVVPLLMFPVVDGQGNVTAQALPKLSGVPVVFPGGGGLRMTFPVKPGDFVTLLCSDRSLDVWKGNASKTPVDPGAGNSHDLIDAVALVGLRSTSKPWTGADTSAITIGTDGAAFQGAGLGHNLRTELDAIWAMLVGASSHTHPETGTTTGPATGSPSKQTVESASVKVSQ